MPNVHRVAEGRVRLELETLEELEEAVKAFRENGYPGNAEVAIDRNGILGTWLVARYWPAGDDDGDDDDGDPVDDPADELAEVRGD